MNNNQVSCSGCGKVYQALSEITAVGGRVYSLGLALKARCICGNGLGGVNHLWKWVGWGIPLIENPHLLQSSIHHTIWIC